ncbi:MAG: PLP-dependent aminotransferase family protein [Planctomycetota bacterium]|nr:PLP-dependent aminotransferase family protein [Planctomycetota bacterium]MSR38596.1 PLP-dependent aminotransferase family protein [Planctomycetota bacterium]
MAPLTVPLWLVEQRTLARSLIPELDRGDEQSLAAQIASFYREAIQGGRMRAGDRLPAIRQVAEGLSVTRATVQEAYRQLGISELVEGVVGRGTTVLPGKLAAGATAADAELLSAYASAALRQSQQFVGAPPLPRGRTQVANFAELSPDAARFPVAELRRAMDFVLGSRGAELLGYAHSPAGLPELLLQLAQWDPMRPLPDDILITSGGQQALDLVLRTLCAPGDAVVLTNPSYHQMHGLLKAHGLRSIPVPMDHRGLDLVALRAAMAAPDVRLVYLMPTFHNPTGYSLDEQQRRAAMNVIVATNVPVLEDEYQILLRCRGEQPPSLRQLDPRGLTLAAFTFSKGLFPGLRMGWVTGAPKLLRPMSAVKRYMDLETSPLLQAALVEFVASGAMHIYLDELRAELRLRHATLQQHLRVRLPSGCTLTDPEGGYLCWLELPEAGLGDRLAELAAERGVRVVPGRMFDSQGKPSRGVRLSLSRANPDEIRAGAEVLAECCQLLLGAEVVSNARVFV